MVTSAPLKRASAPKRQFVVRAHRDSETGGWWVDSDDIPGLVTEAPTYDELVDRVIAVVPDLCAANNLAVTKGDRLLIQREGAMADMSREEWNATLSKLGEQIWNTIWSNDPVIDAIHELIAAKLRRDGIAESNFALPDDAAEAIFGDNSQSPNIVRPKRFVQSKDWTKNSLYNLAARSILDEALARMRTEQSLPWGEITKVDQ